MTNGSLSLGRVGSVIFGFLLLAEFWIASQHIATWYAWIPLISIFYRYYCSMGL